MIMKLKNQRSGPKGALEPVKKKDVTNVYTILNGIRDGKNARRRCGDNIDMDHKVRIWNDCVSFRIGAPWQARCCARGSRPS
jgi:hypothetical protein